MKIRKPVVFLLVLFLLSVSLFSCLGKRADQESEKADSKQASGNAQIGDSLDYGNFTITLKGIEQTNGTYFSSPESGNVYVLFRLEVKNNSSEDAFFNSLYFKAYVDDYSAESVTIVGFAKDGAEDISGTVAAGKNKSAMLRMKWIRTGSKWNCITNRL